MKHRRRMGAFDLKPANPIVQLAVVVGGYFLAADPVNDEIDKMLTKTAADGTKTPPTAETKKAVGGVMTAGGGALVLVGKKTWVKTIAGGLAAGIGVKRLFKEFNVISGYQDVPVLGKRKMAGYGDVPTLGAYKAGGSLNGKGLNGRAPAADFHGTGFAVNGAGKMAMQ